MDRRKDGQTGRWLFMEIEPYLDSLTDRQAGRQTEEVKAEEERWTTEMEGYADRRTHRNIDRQKDIQVSRQI